MPSRLVVPAIVALSNAFSQERGIRYHQIKKPTDSKIKKLVLQQIVQAIEKTGALFPSATAPRIVISFLSSLYAPKKNHKEERIKLIPTKPRVRPPIRSALLSRIPIGLRRCEPHNWINSLIQFFLYLPGSWELFSLLPRSGQQLREFSDQYFADQEEDKSLSSADSAELLRFVIKKLPPYFLVRKPALYEILGSLIGAFFLQCPFAETSEIHPVVLHPEWHVVAEGEVFEKKMRENPPEILVRFNEAPCLLKGHYFASPEGVSYDLDAFIELRPDLDHGEHFIAYLKSGGAWYQCDDDRVIQFRSSCLNAPLRRATLLHYRRMDFSGRNKVYFKK